jgi:hypothetical protein
MRELKKAVKAHKGCRAIEEEEDEKYKLRSSSLCSFLRTY